MSEKTIFISYSHDSDAHRAWVLALSERLRTDGIETLLDRYVNGSPPQGWPRWMLDGLDEAGAVLVVCTETYYRRFRGHGEPGKGKGADWEGAIITQEIYDARSRTLKFVPVLFAPEDEKFIPEPLRGVAYYTLTSESAYQSLYDFVLEQSGVEPQPIGALKRRGRARGRPLTFGDSPVELRAKIDIDHLIKFAPAKLIGREVENKLLSDAWDKAVRSRGSCASGLAGVRRSLCVVLLQPGHAGAVGGLVRLISKGSSQLLRRPVDGGQRATRVRQRQAAGPPRRRAADATHS
jgi:hypothetical protein